MDMTQELKIYADIAEMKTDIKYIREALISSEHQRLDKEKRIASLEQSRTYAKATLATTWTVLMFIGWDWFKALFRSIP